MCCGRPARARISSKGCGFPRAVDVGSEVDPEVEMAVMAVPSHAMRDLCARYSFSPEDNPGERRQGIENDSLLRMSEVILDVCGPCPVVSLSGPSHAEEVAQDKPATVVVGGEDEVVCERVQRSSWRICSGSIPARISWGWS